MTAVKGLLGFESTFSRFDSSVSIKHPTQFGNKCATPSVEAWARCAAENASLQ